MTNITTTTDADGICTIVWDMPDRSMNVISADSGREFNAAAQAVAL